VAPPLRQQREHLHLDPGERREARELGLDVLEEAPVRLGWPSLRIARSLNDGRG
jgi:hypothetical protein